MFDALENRPEAPRVLIVRVGAMGDVLHGLPAVTALRHAVPASRIGWAIEPRWAPLAGAPVIDRIHFVPAKAWNQRPCSRETLREIVKLRRELQAEHYDVCIDLQGTIRSSVIGRMAGAPRFVGLKRPRESQAKHLYSARVAVHSASVIEQACELAAAALQLAALAPAPVTVPAQEAAERWCDQTLESLGGQHGSQHGGKRFALLLPGAGWGAKRWPAKRFAELATALSQEDFTVLVNASPDQPDRMEDLAAGREAIAVPCTVAQLIALSRRAAVVIGGDTGPMHLAAALGRPTVALFGPTDPARNGPAFPGANTICLRHPTSALDHRRHPQTETGLSRIGVDEVVAAVHTVLARERHG